MAILELKAFSVLEEVLLLKGALHLDQPCRGLWLIFDEEDRFEAVTQTIPDGGGGTACWVDFRAIVELSVERRSKLQTLSLEVVLADGSTERIQNLRDGRLAAESWWNTATKFFNDLRARGTGTLLEVGSRARSGITRREFVPEGWDYVGLDVAEGPNVDRVGDGHELSTLFPPAQFDAVMGFSVLEHLMMPWKFAVELNRVLKIGAVGLFVTHQAWPVHEEPWDFFRFSDTSWDSLLNRATGFEVIEAKMAEPAYLVAQYWHGAVDHRHYMCYQSSTVYFRKISDTQLTWPVTVGEITDTKYPV